LKTRSGYRGNPEKKQTTNFKKQIKNKFRQLKKAGDKKGGGHAK